ncbi:DUF2637 domain-containing protein [Streptomyces litchfieldiae]|uniref:DUF2637 domain-containing protein n=1 Tax=Streptomyces litchfieldiae TaxID=3075543 RepID=A0ABU2N1R5_9ACTN|nr:DUF2637 domain-containing protein [Streptomyces sp. DSM 44938]MDT0347547.1 DUF2637 domain-containing protein [Streptomyces sp. DSM 44938]
MTAPPDTRHRPEPTPETAPKKALSGPVPALAAPPRQTSTPATGGSQNAPQEHAGSVPVRTQLRRWEILLVVVGALLAAGVSTLGLISSYQALYDMANTPADQGGWGWKWPWLLPIGIDLSILAFGVVNLLLVRFKRPLWWVRWVPRAATGVTIYLNWTAASSLPSQLGHAGLAALWVVFSEVAAHLYAAHIDPEGTKQARGRRVPTSRWILSPFATARIARQMTLWELTYPEALERDQERRVYVERMRQIHGRRWKREEKLRQKQLPLLLAPYGLSVEQALAVPLEEETKELQRQAAAEAQRVEAQAQRDAAEAQARARKLEAQAELERREQELAAARQCAEAERKAEAQRLAAEAQRAEMEAQAAAHRARLEREAEERRLTEEAEARAAELAEQAERRREEARRQREKDQLAWEMEQSRARREMEEEERLREAEAARRAVEEQRQVELEAARAAAERERIEAERAAVERRHREEIAAAAEAERRAAEEKKAAAEAGRREAEEQRLAAEEAARADVERAAADRRRREEAAAAVAAEAEAQRRQAEERARVAELERAAVEAAAMARLSPAEFQAHRVAAMIAARGEHAVTLEVIKEELGVSEGTAVNRRKRAMELLDGNGNGSRLLALPAGGSDTGETGAEAAR